MKSHPKNMEFHNDKCSFCNHTRFGHDGDTQKCTICNCKHFKEPHDNIDPF